MNKRKTIQREYKSDQWHWSVRIYMLHNLIISLLEIRFTPLFLAIVAIVVEVPAEFHFLKTHNNIGAIYYADAICFLVQLSSSFSESLLFFSRATRPKSSGRECSERSPFPTATPSPGEPRHDDAMASAGSRVGQTQRPALGDQVYAGRRVILQKYHNKSFIRFCACPIGPTGITPILSADRTSLDNQKTKRWNACSAKLLSLS